MGNGAFLAFSTCALCGRAYHAYAIRVIIFYWLSAMKTLYNLSFTVKTAGPATTALCYASQRVCVTITYSRFVAFEITLAEYEMKKQAKNYGNFALHCYFTEF